MSSNVKDKNTKTPWLKPIKETRNAPGGVWELHLTIPLDEGAVYGQATLQSVPESGLFSEESKMAVWANDEPISAVKWRVDVDGELNGAEVDFNVHLMPRDAKFNIMTCHGHALMDQKQYEGTWTMSCLDPEGCGCNGATGTFRLSAL